MLRSPRPRLLVATSPLLAAAACAGADPTSPDRRFTATAAADGITLGNERDVPVCYFAIAQGALSNTDVGLEDCTPAARNSSLAAGAHATRPWSSPGGSSDDHTSLVWWWTGHPGGDGTWLTGATAGQIVVTR